MVGASAQTKSGILLGGSPWGGVNTKFSAAMQENLTRYDIGYKSNMMLGYRFRVPHYDIPAFLDIDAMAGLNNWSSGYKEKTTNRSPSLIMVNMIFITTIRAKTTTPILP